MSAAAISCIVLLAAAAAVSDKDLPDAKQVPDVQVVPLPNNEASFQHQGRELTRYYYGLLLARPFWYPVAGPVGRSLSRMGHPRDPQGHSHHNSVWISHNDVQGISFWADRGSLPLGRIVHQSIEEFEDGPTSAWMLTRNAWQGLGSKAVLLERRRAEVRPLDAGQWLMLIDLQLETPADKPVVLGMTPFGMIGVRMAKTVGVLDGGGRILNSSGEVNEKRVFRRPARWVDYSGLVTNQVQGGIALLDHPGNPDHPTPFHVRDDGWMGASLTLTRPLTIAPGKPLHLRYGLWVHSGVPKVDEVEQRWQAFAKDPMPAMTRARK
jgi:hypothetical protein